MEDEYWVVGDDTQPFSQGLCVCKMLKFHPQRPTIRRPSRGQLFEILAQNLIFLQKCPAPTPIKVKNKKMTSIVHEMSEPRFLPEGPTVGDILRTWTFGQNYS